MGTLKHREIGSIELQFGKIGDIVRGKALLEGRIGNFKLTWQYNQCRAPLCGVFVGHWESHGFVGKCLFHTSAISSGQLPGC